MKNRDVPHFLMFCFLVCVCYLGLSGHAQAQHILRVDGDAGTLPPPDGTADGLDWGPFAFENLQDALARADTLVQAGGTVTIWVASSINPQNPDEDADDPDGSGDPEESFGLISDVRVLGGFAGHESTEEGRNPALNETVLSGQIRRPSNPNFGVQIPETPDLPGDPVFYILDNSYSVVTAESVESSAELDGFTVTQGVGDGNQVDYRKGAGIRIGGQLGHAGSPQIINCLITGNRVHTTSSTAEAWGGGIAVLDSDDDVVSEPIIRNCRIEDNMATRAGGGISVERDAVAGVVNCEIRNNLVEGTNGRGGGVLFYDIDAAAGKDNTEAGLFDCLLELNEADCGGGVAFEVIHGTNPRVRLQNCLIIDNQAEVGGGVIANRSTPHIVNCTVSRNAAGAGAGNGLHAVESTDFSPLIENSIFWSNDGSDQDDQIAGDATVNYSCVQGSPVFGGTGNINTNPLFVDAPNGNFRVEDGAGPLVSQSPCIDTGNDAGVPADVFDVDLDSDLVELTPTRDLFPRVIDSVAAGSEDIDMGAFENCPYDIDDTGAVDEIDMLIVIADWQCSGSDCEGDVDRDGDTDIDDLTEIILHWRTCNERQAPSSVEECIRDLGPDPIVVIGCAMAGEEFGGGE